MSSSNPFEKATSLPMTMLSTGAQGAELDIGRQRGNTHKLGKRAARQAPVVVHLEKPVARVHPALHEIQVMLVVGTNVRDAFIVDRDSCRALQARKALRRFSQYCCANAEQQRKRESSQHDDFPPEIISFHASTEAALRTSHCHGSAAPCGASGIKQDVAASSPGNSLLTCFNPPYAAA